MNVSAALATPFIFWNKSGNVLSGPIHTPQDLVESILTLSLR